MVSFFAAAIDISLKAEPLFKIGPVPVNNSMLGGLLSMIIIVPLFLVAARKVKYRPTKSKLAAGVEYIVNFIIDMLAGVFGTRDLAVKYAPLYISIFSIIVTSYILSLIPLFGPGIYMVVEGTRVPLLRALTADLNATVAMAIVVIVGVQIMSIRTQGVKKHLQHYFSDKPWQPLNFLIGLIEVFDEFVRILSLSLRLFLNTAVGDILIIVFASLLLSHGQTPLAAAPILLFEILIAGIQSYVFTVLAATYYGLAVAHMHEDAHDDHQAPVIKDTMVEARSLVEEPLH